MSTAECAALVEQADPERGFASMAAPPKLRPDLLALYAFNVEISRAAWASHEPMLCEIRLQYWRDQVAAAFAGQPVSPHPVMTPFSEVIAQGKLPETDISALISARQWDVHKVSFADKAALNAYLTDTGGSLMAMAARLLGLSEDYVPALRDYGAAAALAAFLQAVPELKARARQPLFDESPAFLRALAGEALARLDKCRGQGQSLGQSLGQRRGALAVALPALLSVTEARPLLRMVIRKPSLVLAGGLQRAPFRRKGRAALCQIFKRW